MKMIPAITMTWTIFYTDGDTFVQTKDYPYEYSTWIEKREKIIKECVELYGKNIDHIDFVVSNDDGWSTELDTYRHCR